MDAVAATATGVAAPTLGADAVLAGVAGTVAEEGPKVVAAAKASRWDVGCCGFWCLQWLAKRFSRGKIASCVERMHTQRYIGCFLSAVGAEKPPRSFPTGRMGGGISRASGCQRPTFGAQCKWCPERGNPPTNGF